MTVDLVNGGTAPGGPTNATATDRITRPSIGKGMRIAQVAPLAESVPPKLYGGTERVVAWLVEELVELGHEVMMGSREAGNGGPARTPPPPMRHCLKPSRSERRSSTSSTVTWTGCTFRCWGGWASPS